MKVLALFLAYFFSGEWGEWSMRCNLCDVTDESVSFRLREGEKITLFSNMFSYVRRWEEDPGKGGGLIGYLVGEELVFSGRLNHSREILFIYNMRIARLECIENVSEWWCCPIGWWAKKEKPLYADFGLNSFVISCCGYQIEVSPFGMSEHEVLRHR